MSNSERMSGRGSKPSDSSRRPGSWVAGAASSAGSSLDATRSNVVFLLSVIRRWGKVCFPLGLVCAAVAGAAATVVIWTTYTPVYRATAWLRIEDRRQIVVSTVKAQTDSTKFVQTQVQLICSPLVVGQVLKEPSVAELPEIKRAEVPVDWITKRLKVLPVGGPGAAASELYNIQFDGPDPAVAATVVNGVVSAYVELNSQSESKETQQLVELLEQEKERRAKDLERLQENVRELTKRITGKDPLLAKGDKGSSVVFAPTSPDEDRLGSAEVERQMLEVKLRAYEESIATKKVEIPAVEIDAAIAARKDVTQLRDAIDATKARLERTVQVSAKGDKDPLALQVQQELARNESNLKRLQDRLRNSVTEELQAAELRKREAALADLRKEIADKQGLEGLFRKRIDERLKERENLGGQALELEYARSDLLRSESVYQAICDRALSLRTEMRAPTRVSLLERATPPVQPVAGKSYLIAFIIALAAFCLPFGLALLWEGFARHIVESEQLELLSGIPVIGEIAALPARPRFGRGSQQQFLRDQELYEESIDALRTSLVISDEMKDVKILAVASAVSAEGKTSLASQLAVSLSRASGEKTLLIDGDMRAPDLHGIFEISNEKGLADVLEGTCSAQEAIATEWHEHLHLMPAGRLKHSPYVLLSNGHLESILSELRNSYRHIVIDAPPVLSASEALIIAKASDGTILCALREHTRAPQVKLAQQRLEAAGVRLLGAVLAGVPARRYAYKYGGYYYYGSHRKDSNGKSGSQSGKSVEETA